MKSGKERRAQISLTPPNPCAMNRKSPNSEGKTLTGAQVAEHNSKDSCWVIIHGRAYDVTEFLPEHPGGPKIILKYAGKDATEEYEPIHPPDTLEKYLDKSKHLGAVDMATVEKEEKAEDPHEKERQAAIERMPILEQCYNLMDFEAVAKKVMKKTAWAYYSSGADDEIVSFYPLFNRGKKRGLVSERITNQGHRHCARTTRHSTKYGLGREFWWTLRKSTCRPQCWAPK